METPIHFPSWPLKNPGVETPGEQSRTDGPGQAHPFPIPYCWAVAVIEYLPPTHGTMPRSLLHRKNHPAAAGELSLEDTRRDYLQAGNGNPPMPATAVTDTLRLYHPASSSLPTMLLPGNTVLIPFRLAALEDTVTHVKLRQLFGWLEEQRDLARDHYSDLWQIKDFSLFYGTVKEMALKEMRLLKAYRSGWKHVHGSSLYTANELRELEICYARILLGAIGAMDELLEFTRTLGPSSTAPVRLPPLRPTVERIETLHADLIGFNEEMAALSRRRLKAICTAPSS